MSKFKDPLSVDDLLASTDGLIARWRQERLVAKGLPLKEIPHILAGVYRNWKGDRFRVLGIGQNTETGVPFVVYIPLTCGEPGRYTFDLRPLESFYELVNPKEVQNGDQDPIPRFWYEGPI